MSDVVIRVENLSKEYRLGKIGHGTLYRDIQTGWAKLRGTEDPNAKIGAVNREQLNNTNDRFSALKDVSFDVRQGEIVGIIGRNGAGKSTLLKIISRVTAPTSGTIKIKGRVASLLEVGTGFHPELTGRENIFLNGAILGMHKGEIEQKFDEIVRFAEIDKFIDTPVKRYSSGMYVRLAFAVAAHLEPEILVVDEVLAVGDAEFQKKCLGKMGEVAKEGRTVLFVSHNLRAINLLCAKSLLLNNGKVDFLGKTTDAISRYLAKGEIKGQIIWEEGARPGGDILELLRVSLLDDDKKIRTIFSPHKDITVEVEFILKKAMKDLRISFSLRNTMDETIFISDTYHLRAIYEKEGVYCARCIIPKNFLNSLEYSLHVGVNLPMKLVIIKGFECLRFKVEGYVGNRSLFLEPASGMIAPELDWTVERM